MYSKLDILWEETRLGHMWYSLTLARSSLAVVSTSLEVSLFEEPAADLERCLPFLPCV